VLVAVLVDHGVAAVVGFDHLVAKLGKTLSHRRFPDTRHASYKDALHSVIIR
jgi:hypothetical protein